MRRIKQDALRYAIAALAAVGALFLRRALNPYFGRANPYHTAWLTVVLCAWYCGLGPSIVAVLILLLGIWYWFLPPYGSFTLNSSAEVFGLLGFALFSAVIVALGESTRRTMRRRRVAEEELRKAQQQLEDRVRERTAELNRTTAEVVEKAAMLDSANDAIFVKGAAGVITYWNRGAERLYGWTSAEAMGRSSHDLLRTQFPVPLEEIQRGHSWEGELRHTKRDGTQITVASRWTTLRSRDGKVLGWLEINSDITYRKQIEDAAKRLTGRLLTLQDDERRRIARELHDSLGQYLAVLKMNLSLVAASNTEQAALVTDCSQILDKCLTETRTISHLLHPPLLDEAGFSSAAKLYVDGFAERSGIKITLSLPQQLGRLHPDVEIALFRALQEGLTNVHRHSGSSMVGIHVTLDTNHVRMEIQDNGKGIAANRLKRLKEGAGEAGVGIAGMRERVRELGGSLEIESDTNGTKVIVTLPTSKPFISSPDGDLSASAA